MGWQPTCQMDGQILKGHYGASYYPVGFIFDEGNFTSHKPSGGGTIGLMFSFAKSMFGNEPWKVDNIYIKPYRKNHLSRALTKDYAGPLFFHWPAVDKNATLYKTIDTLHNSYYIGAGFFTQASFNYPGSYTSQPLMAGISIELGGG